MKILTIELSSNQHSAAILDPAGPTGLTISEAVETGSRATRPFGLIERALHEAHLEQEQIECIGVGLGPGSYTGIRGAIAVAQGWELARGVKLLGISSVECIAAQAWSEGQRGRLYVVVDAQRDELYLAGFELNEKTFREFDPLRLALPEQVRAVQSAGAVLAGPEVIKWFPAGRVQYPSAAILARLALNRTDFTPGGKLEPIYLRETRFVKAPPSRVIQ